MNILAAIQGIFGGGLSKSIEGIATEWIETSGEKAEASALYIKTLDPNGLMRRDLSHRVTGLYTLYIIVTLVMLISESFGLGGSTTLNGVEVLNVSIATEKVTSLFTTITTLFGVIVSASFGVSYANVKGGK